MAAVHTSLCVKWQLTLRLQGSFALRRILRDSSGYTLGMENSRLFAAIRSGDFHLIEDYFRTHPEHVNVKNLQATEDNSRFSDEGSTIHCAAKYGHLEIVKLLVELGAEVYSHPLDSYPAVMVAA